MMVDLEIGTCSEGFRDPGAPNQVEEVILDPTAQKAKVSATTRPDSRSESEIPGLWSSWIHKEYCCIYRVPNRLRKQNPEAYTPQALLIGPLHHSKKAEALELSKTDSRYNICYIIQRKLCFCIKYHFKFVICNNWSKLFRV